MICWKCGEKASGICIFCGRAVCKACASRQSHIMAAYDEDGDVPRLLVVENALWCGQCRPVNQAIPMPELEGKKE